MEVTDDHQFIRKNVESIESDPLWFVVVWLESIESDPFGCGFGPLWFWTPLVLTPLVLTPLICSLVFDPFGFCKQVEEQLKKRVSPVKRGGDRRSSVYKEKCRINRV